MNDAVGENTKPAESPEAAHEPEPRRKKRLGWLGPVVVVVGIAVGSVGIWWMKQSRPVPGPYIDVLALDAEWAVAVREQLGSANAFVELRHASRGLVWRALIPPYAGSPQSLALAGSSTAIAVRFVRGRQEHLWALHTLTGKKMGSVHLGDALGAAPVRTFGDGKIAFQVVRNTDGYALSAIDLGVGSELWRKSIGADPVFAATITGDAVVLARGSDGAARTALRRNDGSVEPASGVFTPAPGPGFWPQPESNPNGIGRPPLPGASPMRPYHRAGDVIWAIFPDRILRTTTQTSPP